MREIAGFRRRLANLIYPEGRHLRPLDNVPHDYSRGWNACVQLWNETGHKRLANECKCDVCAAHRLRPKSN